ncbi:MAG TPA: YeeE/YedE thiosulfate transporter family protein [Bryobacteraceae bacterium]
MADPFAKLALGLVTGFIFGFLLQKGHVTRYPVIVGQFLLRDFTVLKTMLTAVLVGGIGVYGLKAFGAASLHVKPAQLAAVSIGGLVFGVGMVLLGYCPGTGVAAAAEGKKDAIFGVLGMLLGALFFAGQFAYLGKNLLTWFDFGPVTLPELLHIPAWLIFICLTAAAAILFRQVEIWEKR